MIRRAAILFLLVATLSQSARAAAGGSDKEARALFQRAEMSFNLGKFAEALTDYQAAYQAKPLPGFLFNIAQCYRNMGNYERARFFYRRYLALDPRTSNRRLVDDLIAEMTRLMEKQEAAPAAGPLAPPPVGEGKPVALALAPASASAAAASGEAPPALLTAPALEPAPRRQPIYKRWWFWTGLGAVVAAGVVATILLTRNQEPTGSLPPIDGR